MSYQCILWLHWLYSSASYIPKCLPLCLSPNSCQQWAEMGWRMGTNLDDREGVYSYSHTLHSSVMLSVYRDGYWCYLDSAHTPRHSLELFPPMSSCFLLADSELKLVRSVEGSRTRQSLRVWSVSHRSVSHQPSGCGWQQRQLYIGWAMCTLNFPSIIWPQGLLGALSANRYDQHRDSPWRFSLGQVVPPQHFVRGTVLFAHWRRRLFWI